MALATEDGLVHVKPMQRVGEYLPHVISNSYGPSEPDFPTQLPQQLGFIWKSCSFGFSTELDYLEGISLRKP